MVTREMPLGNGIRSPTLINVFPEVAALCSVLYTAQAMPLSRLHRLSPHPGDAAAGEVCRSKPSGDSVGNSLAGLWPRCFLAVWVGRAASQKKIKKEQRSQVPWKKRVSIASRSPHWALGLRNRPKPSTGQRTCGDGAAQNRARVAFILGTPLLYGKQ